MGDYHWTKLWSRQEQDRWAGSIDDQIDTAHQAEEDGGAPVQAMIASVDDATSPYSLRARISCGYPASQGSPRRCWSRLIRRQRCVGATAYGSAAQKRASVSICRHLIAGKLCPDPVWR